MMKRHHLLLCLVLLVPCARAGVRPLTLADLCGNAVKIVRGSVTHERVRWEGTTIVTDWTVATTESLKGDARGNVIVKVPGGTIAGLTMRAGEAPRFRIGEDVLVFLRPGVGTCDVYGWFRGKYTILDGHVREKRGTSAADLLESVRAEVSRGRKGR